MTNRNKNEARSRGAAFAGMLCGVLAMVIGAVMLTIGLVHGVSFTNIIFAILPIMFGAIAVQMYLVNKRKSS
ncbi:MAG: hypothetical protein Q4C71_05370 [Microbacteriaceae bacterium]|nr:hypothetical protein [Microbacteriaceae bacterium]